MRNFIFLAGSCLLLTALLGCSALRVIKKPAAQMESNAVGAVLPPYAGLKAHITIADFDVKAAKATGEIGSGLREMLVTALVGSSRFSVLERQALNAPTQEQESAVSGASGVSPGNPQKDKIKAADLIVSTAVTEFEPQASGGKAGIGGGGGAGSGILGGLLGPALNKAHMALDIRIIDASTSEVLAVTRVQGQASDVAGSIMGGYLGGWGLGMGLSAYANTPMEKAIRICIIEAVRYVSQAIPANYYKY